MCMSASRATNPCHGKDKNFIRELHLTLVRTVEQKRAREPACARDLAQIDRINSIIIKILRNMVVVFCFNCYHRIDRSDSYGYG